MRTRLKLRPGQRGTKKLLAKYGDRLVCVRYRYDEEHHKRLKTVELIVDEVDWHPKPPPIPGDAIVELQIERNERNLQSRIKAAGGRWNPGSQLWEIRYDRAAKLGLAGRVIPPSRSRGR